MTDLLDEPLHVQRRISRLGSIVLIVGVVVIIVVFGLALSRRNEMQPKSGIAPDFTLMTFDGNQIRLSGQLGKVVVINFWASWCIPCRDEAPALQATWEHYKDKGVLLIGVDYADTDENARAFIREFGITYPNGPDIGIKIFTAYRVQGVPETFVIDQQGNVAQFLYAGVNENQLSNAIDPLLAENNG